MIIAIDPGMKGAIAAINNDGSFVALYRMPTMGTNYDNEKACVLLDDLVSKSTDRLIFASEEISFMNERFVSGLAGLSYHTGVLAGNMFHHHPAMHSIPPSEWKRTFQIVAHATRKPREEDDTSRKSREAGNARARRESKAKAVLIARSLFPEASEYLQKKDDDGPAEALLIAEHVRRKLGYQNLY